MTPRQVYALDKRWRASEEAKNGRARLIGFYMYNAMGAKKVGGGAFTPADFGLGGEPEKRPTLEQLQEMERMGEEMLKAKAEGRPNPFLPDPDAEGLKLNAETILKVLQ